MPYRSAEPLTCEDLVMQCYNIMFTLPGPHCCQKLFRRTVTPIGVCYRSAFTGHFAQAMPGEDMGINIVLHVPQNTEADLDWSILKENLHTVSGLQISIINSISIPSLKVLGERIVIQPKTKVSVAVDHSVINNVEATRGLWPFAPPRCTPKNAPPTELLKTMRNCFLYRLYLRFSGGNCSILATQSFTRG
ncbi:uncharacterized protein LOC125040450 [Penaeus chinensis]|uniref:uncharacterized protein LOC125040450 n=1 Tax=Penaeus chinensis TaxID=139456 RepID=UPI001FB79D68|nr:uncharacterized protein LOC125040450 [Penaeus chinensis]